MTEANICSQCSRKLEPEQVYIYQANAYCEDCLMKVGLTKRQCDPWRLAKETGGSKSERPER